MIKAPELRLGNWISYKGEFNFVVANINHEGAGDHEDAIYFEPNLTPIEISPEILEKAGFDNTKGNSTSNYKYWCTVGIIDVRFREDGFTVFEVGGGAMTERNHIKYLHQIQNFYHALTGEELTIQL